MRLRMQYLIRLHLHIRVPVLHLLDVLGRVIHCWKDRDLSLGRAFVENYSVEPYHRSTNYLRLEVLDFIRIWRVIKRPYPTLKWRPSLERYPPLKWRSALKCRFNNFRFKQPLLFGRATSFLLNQRRQLHNRQSYNRNWNLRLYHPFDCLLFGGLFFFLDLFTLFLGHWLFLGDGILILLVSLFPHFKHLEKVTLFV
jgi:hypothetical protein